MLEILVSTSSRLRDGEIGAALLPLGLRAAPILMWPRPLGGFGTEDEVGARSLDLRAGLHVTTFLISARCNLQFEIFIIVSLHFAKLCCEKRLIRALILSLGPRMAMIGKCMRV